MYKTLGHILANCLRGTAVLAASACLSVSCIWDRETVMDEEFQAGNTYVTLAVDTGLSGTKADAGRAAVDDTETGTAEESEIHSVRAWAFSSRMPMGSALPLGYTEAKFDGDVVAGSGSVGGIGAGDVEGFRPGEVLSGGLRAVNVRIPDVSTDKIDIYVIVNGESGCSLISGGHLVRGDTAVSGMLLTRSELESAVFSGPFGVNADGTPSVTSVPAAGLPMSSCVKGLSLAEYRAEIGDAVPEKIDVPLLRSVAKLQFFFAKKEGVDGLDEFRIESIVLAESDGDGMSQKDSFLPVFESVFSSGSGASVPADASYGLPLSYGPSGTSSWYLHSSGIKAVADPLEYRRGAYEDAEDYMSRLRGAGLTTGGCAYLYETGRRTRGIITYRRSAADSQKKFKFEIPSGDFLRNKENVIYVYMLEGKLVVTTELKYQVVDWEGNFSADIKFN